MRKIAKRNDKNPTKTKKIKKKTVKLRTRQASKLTIEISSNKTQRINMKISVTGKLQRKLTIKGPSIDPGMRVEILEV